MFVAKVASVLQSNLNISKLQLLMPGSCPKDGMRFLPLLLYFTTCCFCLSAILLTLLGFLKKSCRVDKRREKGAFPPLFQYQLKDELSIPFQSWMMHSENCSFFRNCLEGQCVNDIRGIFNNLERVVVILKGVPELQEAFVKSHPKTWCFLYFRSGLLQPRPVHLIAWSGIVGGDPNWEWALQPYGFTRKQPGLWLSSAFIVTPRLGLSNTSFSYSYFLPGKGLAVQGLEKQISLISLVGTLICSSYQILAGSPGNNTADSMWQTNGSRGSCVLVYLWAS